MLELGIESGQKHQFVYNNHFQKYSYVFSLSSVYDNVRFIVNPFHIENWQFIIVSRYRI